VTVLLRRRTLSNYNTPSDESEGGYATIHWTVNGTVQSDFNFNIEGDNADENVVDSFYNTALSVPWFWGSLLAQESSGRQYNASGGFQGFPLAVQNPDGIGISQIDGTQNTVSDFDYWNYEANVEDGLKILQNKATESQNNWINNYTASGNTDPSSSDTRNPYSYCDFVANTQPLGNGSFGDADWIQDYNSHSSQHWYIWWNSTTGAWNFKYNTSEAGNLYVPDVCGKAPY